MSFTFGSREIVTMTSTSHDDSLHLFSDVPWMAIYICEAFLILTGNSVAVYIFWSIRRRLKRTTYLLINLAVADILVGIALILWLWDGIAAISGRSRYRWQCTLMMSMSFDVLRCLLLEILSWIDKVCPHNCTALLDVRHLTKPDIRTAISVIEEWVCAMTQEWVSWWCKL